jgi:murein tripeptide amidase MpaA
MRPWYVVVASLLLAVPAPAQDGGGKTLNLGYSGTEAILPPEGEWNGRSRELLVPASDPWATGFERGGLGTTSGYDESVAWLRKLADASPQVTLVSLGKSGEGRDVWMAVVSAEGASTPQALHASGKPVLLAQAGIHAGEIDGKDAGMMLLRDLTVRGTKKSLLDGASFLFVPALNVDGLARFSRYNRVNQRGPEETGWRTNAANLNLNRDWTKLDTPEVRAMVAMVREWTPDLWVDLHVTDGEDYQYDITWGYNGPNAFSPNQAAWLDAYFTPAATRDLKAWGHVPGPLVFSVDPTDLTRGIRLGTADSRLTHGYGDARHIASVLVENHSLKPYSRRVLGTYVLLESALRTLGSHGKELERAAAADGKIRRGSLPLGWKAAAAPSGTMEFLGIRSRRAPSPVSGGLRVEWTGEPVTLQVPVYRDVEPETTVSLPKAYWIPAAWTEVADRVALHGITVERIGEPRRVEGTVYRLTDAAIEEKPYEGRVRVTVHPVPEKRSVEFPAGSYRVSTDQPLGELAGLLLEPSSPDSYFQWGFFLATIERKEYIEGYVMEAMAARMLAEMPGLAEEFNRKLAGDPGFAADPRARLDWFYRKTPYFDERWRVYPVAREE